MTQLTKDEEATKRVYDRTAKQWADAHTSADFWKEELTMFQKLMPSGKVLEIGAGGGRDAKELIKLGYEYVGTDISAGLIAVAQQANPGAAFQQISIYDLDFAEPFDGFWCSAVLLHIPKRRINEALRAIKKNIKPGGIGFIATKEGEGEQVEADGRLFVFWSNGEFKKLLTSNGFEVVHEGYRPMSKRTKWLMYHVRAV